MCQEPKNLAELQLGVRNFCGDFNARKSRMKQFYNLPSSIFSDRPVPYSLVHPVPVVDS